jgi:hypothetical protein
MRIVSLALAVLTFGATAQSQDLKAIAPLIVDDVVAHANGMAARLATGPLLVDVASFETHFAALGAGGVNEDKLLTHVGKTAKKATQSEAVHCETKPVHKCQVVDNGLFIRLDSLSAHDGDVDAVTTLMWMDRRRSGSVMTGRRILRQTYEPSGTGWKLAKTVVLLRT